MTNFIEILHDVSNKLTDVTEEQQIFQIMNDGIKQILPHSYFFSTKLIPETMTFKINHSFGVEKYISAIKKILGKDPYVMDFPFSDLSEERQKMFESRTLYHFPEGLYDIINKKVNIHICKAIEKTLSISEVYAMSFCIGEKHFGGAAIFIKKSNSHSDKLDKECILTIENLTSQVSFALNKIRDFETLTKKDHELEIAHIRFNQLVNQLNDIVWIAKGDGTEIRDLNNSFEKYSGYPSSQFKKNSRFWINIIHAEDKEIVKNAQKELLASGNAEYEYRVIRADGAIIWIHERDSIVYNKQGKPVQMGGLASDITEKKLLEEQLRLKNYTLDNSPNAIAFSDLQGHLNYVNNAYVKLFGYDNQSELINKQIADFASPLDNPKIVSESLRNGKRYSGNFHQPMRKDGSTFHSIILASPVKHKEKTLCMMIVFIDITKLKEMEAELKESEAKLLKSNKEKDKFFTIIAHDLKSPFNGMLGLLKLLSNNYPKYNDEKRLTIINSSYQAAKKAHSLLIDLLEWARLQNNAIEIKKETIDLNAVINDNIILYQNDSQAKGILTHNNIGQNTLVNIDLNSINTLVRNIFMNAIKFTEKGDDITFEAKEINNAFELMIKDTGVGMNEETLSKLFKLDENISTLGTNNEKGTGLGLLICNEIVTKNNWKINVESHLYKGTSFKISIPLN